MNRTPFSMQAIVFLAFFCVSTYSAAEGKMHKWKDKNGVTQYGEVIPPEYAGQEVTDIDKRGLEVKKKEKVAVKKERVATQEELDQQRKDQALLSSFTSSEDIDLARDRNLQQVNAGISGIQMRIKSAEEDLASLKKEKEGNESAHKAVPQGLLDDIKTMGAKIDKLKGELEKSKADAAKIRDRYDSDKKRFIELTTKVQ